MRNFKLFKQINFSGGMNTETPDAISDETQLKRIVNLIPSEDANALVLRPSFEEYPNTPSGAIAGTIISIFPFRGWVSDVEDSQENLFESDDLMVVYAASNGDSIVTRLISGSGYAATGSLLINDIIWSPSGTVVPEDESGVMTPPPNYSAYRIAFNDNSISFPSMSSTSYEFMNDYWVSIDSASTYGDGSSNRMGENDSEWIGEDWTFTADLSDEDGWNDPIGTTAARAFDVWFDEDGTTDKTVRDNISTTGTVRFVFPWQLNSDDTDVVGITQPQPRRQECTFLFSPPEANVDCYILFSKSDALSTAMRYDVYYKKSDPAVTTWTTATKLSGVDSPVVCYDQSSAYGEVTIDTVEYVKVPFTIPWKQQTSIKISAAPSLDTPSNMLYNGAAVYFGVE